MKKRTFYFSLIIIGIIIPFLVLFVCRLLNIESAYISPIITSIASTLTIILNIIKSLADKGKMNQMISMTTKNTTIGNKNTVITQNRTDYKGDK